MGKKKVGPVLFHILEAIEGIQSSIDKKTIEDYQQNWLLRLGTQRALEIISEASRVYLKKCLNLPQKFLGKKSAELATSYVMSIRTLQTI